VKIRCRKRRTSCSTLCQSIDSQSRGSSSGPFNTAAPDNDGDAAAAGVLVVMLSNLSFGSGVVVISSAQLT